MGTAPGVARVLLIAQRAADRTLDEAKRRAEEVLDGAEQQAAATIARAEATAAERVAAQQDIARIWAELVMGSPGPGPSPAAENDPLDVRRLLHEVLWFESQREQELLTVLRSAQTRLHEELAEAMDGVQRARQAREELAARVDGLLAAVEPERAIEGPAPADPAQATGDGVGPGATGKKDILPPPRPPSGHWKRLGKDAFEILAPMVVILVLIVGGIAAALLLL